MILLLVLSGSAASATQAVAAAGEGWPTYGGDPGGQRYSNAAQITRTNVSRLQPAWTYHTHALEAGMPSVSRSDFEATPIFFEGTLYLSTPFDRVIALDPATGAERWTYDPALPKDVIAANYTSRGVAAWKGLSGHTDTPCGARIFVVTLDARLIAVDTTSGKPCADFGQGGQVDLRRDITTGKKNPYQFYGNTSPATVVGDVVVVGSAVGDNQAVSVEPGVVRGFDARTGRLLWSWDPLPWAATQSPRTGAGNAWSVIAADPARNMVFVPTGAAAPDFWGGFRPGDDRDANSLVALDARTGRKVWAFQLIHHDVWDYDTASEPLLFQYKGTPAVAIAPKTGVLFVLNRLTGEPLIPVTEQPVPQNGAPGDILSPTQPFSALPPLTPIRLDLNALLASHHGDKCAQHLAGLRYDGIFTPPGVGRSTLQFPGSLGGVNWGSMSLDPVSNILYANTNHSAYEIRLIPQPTRLHRLAERRAVWTGLAALVLLAGALLRRRAFPGVSACVAAALLIAISLYIRTPSSFTYHRRHNMVNSPDSAGEVSPNNGAPFQIFRRVLQDDDGRPCTFQPWGATTALNLNAGAIAWQKPLGTLIAGQHTGTINFGAPIVTAGGLLFTAASSEPLLRAIDESTGEEVWTGPLPVPAQSTPMTYTANGRQFVVVAAGGHGGLGTPLGDSVVAFALR